MSEGQICSHRRTFTTYEYDRADNKLLEIRQHEQDRREDYTYDSRYRLVSFTRQEESKDSWELDGVGNWATRQGVSNQLDNMNEYTSFAGVPQLYDDNGNLIDDGTNHYQYDISNRLRRVIRKADNAIIAVYRYDAQGRRTERTVTHTESFDEQVHYLYNRWREIEERRHGSTHQYVYGLRIDEPLTLDNDANDDGMIDTTFFYHDDAKSYITALTDETGGLAEQYRYDAYGKPSFFGTGGTPLQRTAVNNLYLFAGRRLDPEIGFYYYLNRVFNPTQGRFTQRDPLGYEDGMNGYE